MNESHKYEILYDFATNNILSINASDPNLYPGGNKSVTISGLNPATLYNFMLLLMITSQIGLTLASFLLPLALGVDISASPGGVAGQRLILLIRLVIRR